MGELLGLVDQSDASRNFAGYTDEAATRKRLVRDVLGQLPMLLGAIQDHVDKVKAK